MKHTDHATPPDGRRTQQLAQALNEVDRLVKYGCAEMVARGCVMDTLAHQTQAASLHQEWLRWVPSCL